jgi:hypothetical protein
LAFAFAEPGSAEYHRAREAQREAYRGWVEAEPSNSEALYGHALAIEDPVDRRAALDRLLQADPEHPWGQFLLGEMELDDAAAAGLERMQRAFDGAEGTDKREFGERLIEAYEQRGLVAEAQAVRDQLAELSFGP